MRHGRRQQNEAIRRASEITHAYHSTTPGCAGGLNSSLMAQTAPAVIFTNPSNDATGVPTSINNSKNIVTATALTATFSQPMNPSTIDSLQAGQQLTFTLTDASGNNVRGTVAMDVTNTVATFTPTVPALNPNTSYVATVTTKAASAGGIRMARPVTWSFMTKNVPFYRPDPCKSGNCRYLRYPDKNRNNGRLCL